MTLVRGPRHESFAESDAPGDTIAYDADPFSWAIQQAALLRSGHLDRIDAVNIADEIADVAHYLSDKLASDLIRVVQHLLKWDHQAARRGRSWMLSIREHRRRVATHVRKAPGLASTLPQIMDDVYESARNAVLVETDLPESALPAHCPYSWDEIMTRPIAWPHDS